MRPSRPLLHKARMADAVLFWPLLAYVVWGEVVPQVPDYLAQTSDKVLHFGAFFCLAAMAAASLKRRGPTMAAVAGLIVLGGILEIIQGFVGRDMSFYDELANAEGALSGGIIARLIVEYARRRFGYR